jgi:hypothetical protein
MILFIIEITILFYFELKIESWADNYRTPIGPRRRLGCCLFWIVLNGIL